MAISVYEIGESVHLTATFSLGGNAISPDGLTCKVRLPNGSVSDLTVTGADGSYQATISADLAGMHFYRWECVGAAEEGQFRVIKSRVI